jgi:hypothetical protein
VLLWRPWSVVREEGKSSAVDREVLCWKLSPRQPEMYGSLLFSLHFFVGAVRSPKAVERFSSMVVVSVLPGVTLSRTIITTTIIILSDTVARRRMRQEGSPKSQPFVCFIC